MMPPEIATSGTWKAIFSRAFMQQNLSLVAIDEAHCIMVSVFLFLFIRSITFYDFMLCCI